MKISMSLISDGSGWLVVDQLCGIKQTNKKTLYRPSQDCAVSPLFAASHQIPQFELPAQDCALLCCVLPPSHLLQSSYIWIEHLAGRAAWLTDRGGGGGGACVSSQRGAPCPLNAQFLLIACRASRSDLCGAEELRQAAWIS